MPLKLPTDTAVSVPKPRPKESTASEPLMTGDTIEYSITMEVSPSKGSKAWLKFGTTSTVRDGETTEQARLRVCRYVEENLDKRLDELK